MPIRFYRAIYLMLLFCCVMASNSFGVSKGGIGGLLARTDANGSTFYHADGNGNITALMDGNENIVARYLYNPYGKLLGQWGSLASANEMQFSSMPQHRGIALYPFRGYEPNFQRWLNRDPIGEAGGINIYEAFFNSPLRFVDRSGRDNIFNMSAGNSAVPNITLSAPSGGGPVSTQYNGGGFSDPFFMVAGMTVGSWAIAPAAANPEITLAALINNWPLPPSSSSNGGNGKKTKCPPPSNGGQPLLGMAKANEGDAPKHGGDVHNQMIDDYIKNLPEGADNIRKNQQQVDFDGNTVGNNRPDIQYDLDGQHYNVEIDTDPNSSFEHFKAIINNDPVSPVELIF